MKLGADYYRIRVRGHLARRRSDWFDGFQLTYHDNDSILAGSVVVQAALQGVLAKIRDFGLTILLVENLDREVEDDDLS